MFSTLPEIATTMLSNKSDQGDEASTKGTDLKLNEFVGKSLLAITATSKNKSPTLNKYISFIIDNVNETLDDANELTINLEESKLEQVFKQTGNDDDSASNESEFQVDAKSTEPEIAAV